MNHSGQSDLANLSGLRHLMDQSVLVLLMLSRLVRSGRLDQQNHSGLSDLWNQLGLLHQKVQ